MASTVGDLQLCDANDAAAESAARVARRLAQLVAALAEVVLAFCARTFMHLLGVSTILTLCLITCFERFCDI